MGVSAAGRTEGGWGERGCDHGHWRETPLVLGAAPAAQGAFERSAAAGSCRSNWSMWPRPGQCMRQLCTREGGVQRGRSQEPNLASSATQVLSTAFQPLRHCSTQYLMPLTMVWV